MTEPRAEPLAALLGVFVAGTIVVQAQDWPQWRGPNRDGVSEFARRHMSGEIPQHSPLVVIRSLSQPCKECPQVTKRVGLADAEVDKSAMCVRIIDESLVDVLVARRVAARAGVRP